MSPDVKQSAETKIRPDPTTLWKRRGLRVIPLAALVALLGYLSLVYWIIDPLLIMVGLILLLVVVLDLVRTLSRDLFIRTKKPDCRRSALVGISFLFFFIAVQCAGASFYQLNFYDAMVYPELVVPILEQYHQLNGKYPENLDSLPNIPLPPWGVSYFTSGKGYVFAYPAGGSTSCYMYSSERPEWKHFLFN